MFLYVRKLGEVGRVGHKPSNGSPFGLASKSLEIDEQRQELVVIDSGEDMLRTRNLCIVRINLVPALIESGDLKEGLFVLDMRDSTRTVGGQWKACDIDVLRDQASNVFSGGCAAWHIAYSSARYALNEASIRELTMEKYLREHYREGSCAWFDLIELRDELMAEVKLAVAGEMHTRCGTRYEVAMHWDVIKVRPLEDYTLYVELEDGREGVFDLKPYLNQSVFRELQDKSYFARVDIVFGAVTWPNEQDIAPRLCLRGYNGAINALQSLNGGQLHFCKPAGSEHDSAWLSGGDSIG